MLNELFNMNSSDLFRQASILAEPMETLLCSPIPITTECQMTPPCRHCWWRSMSFFSQDFWRRRTLDEVARRAGDLSSAGIQRLLLPAGWLGYELPEWFYTYVQQVKKELAAKKAEVEIFATCGPISWSSLSQLKEAGLDGYWCGIEVPNPELFRQVRPGDSLKARFQTLEDAGAAGLKIWSSFLFGIGESEKDLVWGLKKMKALSLDSFSLTPFEQYPYVEMEQRPAANLYDWARTAAIARIYIQDVNCFTSPSFASWGLRAGINSFLPVFPALGQVEQINNMRSYFNEGIHQHI